MNAIPRTMNGSGFILPKPWWAPLGAMVAAIAVLLGIYSETLASMVAIWLRSETFAHGFLIAPISLWLVWRRRRHTVRLVPRPDYRVLPILIACGFGWLLGHLAGVMLVEQAAFVAMIPSLVWLVLGRAVAWDLAFPLGFLLFSVPVGEFLIPHMMDFTADFTVTMLRITGIPVYREGTFFSIPSGDWSVVEACSGLRYLIASITLGCLYAYLTYHSLRRRLAFIGLAVVFPILANGLRAYLIVMLAHLSDMTLAVGVDHLIYGWVFFGIVMLLLFWIGGLWREGGACEESFPPMSPSPRQVAFASSAVAAVLVAAVWPAWAAAVQRQLDARTGDVILSAPQAVPPWQTTADFTDWEPLYFGADREVQAFYSDGKNIVGLYLLCYRRQRQGEELINSQNVLVRQKHAVWKMPEEKAISVPVLGEPATVWQGILHSEQQNLLTWRWNWISGVHTANPFIGKALEARDKLLGRISDESAIVLATPYGDDKQAAAHGLQRFVDLMLPTVEQRLREAAER